jgi:hypothetical protein
MADATDKPRISYVTIATLHYRAEAQPIVSTLAAAGIRCLLTDESEVVAGVPAGDRQVEFKVQVSRGDVGRALELLSNHARASSPSVVSSPRRRVVSIHIGAGRGLVLALVGLIGAAGLLALLL